MQNRHHGGGMGCKLQFAATGVGANIYLHPGARLQRINCTHRGSQPHVCGQEVRFRAEPPPWGGGKANYYLKQQE